MPMNRTDRIGIGLSAALHLGLIVWVAFGDWLFRPKPPQAIEMTEVAVMSEAEFAALVAAAPKPSDRPVSEPEAPRPAARPEPPEPEPTPAPEPEPEPAPEPTPEPEPDPEPEVADLPPPLPVPPVEVPSEMLTEVSPRPKPKPAPRVAPTPAEAPEPDAQVADTAVEQTRPEDTAEPEEVVEPPKENAAPPEATTQIVTEATETEQKAQSSVPLTSSRPKTRPAKPAQPAKPAAPAPTQTAQTRTDAVADALAEALAGAATEGTGGVGRAASGPPLTSGEKDALVIAVKACWNVGALSSDALRTVVTVGFDMTPDGRPVGASIRRLSYEGGNETAAAQAYEAGRRAILRCGANGFPLPPEKFDQWAQVEIVFNPEKMRMK
ncbi:cell division and transport-associated protein TolA [Phaeovulum veldkampii DSM 11550]|nr:cell division and transport-associated protein TolA [Phaeovulum veldkampii DSM 11550]